MLSAVFPQAINLKRLAVYFDVSSSLWQDQDNWIQLPEEQWDSSFLPLIHKEVDAESSQSFLLRPIDGSMNYRRRRKPGQSEGHEAKQKIDLRLEEISVHLSRQQYEHAQNLLTVFNLYEVRFDCCDNVSQSALWQWECRLTSQLQRVFQ